MKIAITTLLFISIASAEPTAPVLLRNFEDNVAAVVAIVPKLNCAFFGTQRTAYNWWIIEKEDGKLEDTMDGVIEPEDLLRGELTALCHSSHQGKHKMEYCDAVITADGVHLTVWGGAPAYTGNLDISIDSKLNVKCSFAAIYPEDKLQVSWKLTKKVVRLKSSNFIPGTRLFGWVSIEFTEIDISTGKSTPHKIEGYFKPIIRHNRK